MSTTVKIRPKLASLPDDPLIVKVMMWQSIRYYYQKRFHQKISNLDENIFDKALKTWEFTALSIRGMGCCIWILSPLLKFMHEDFGNYEPLYKNSPQMSWHLMHWVTDNIQKIPNINLSRMWASKDHSKYEPP